MVLLVLLVAPAGSGRAQVRDGGTATEVASRWSLFAVGDTGRKHRILPSLIEGQIAVGNAMWREHQRDPVDDFVLLGDNFYKDGLRSEELVSRIRENVVYPYCGFLELDGARSSEVESACKVPRADRRPIPIHVTLGNHDLIAKESQTLQREAVPEFISNWKLGLAMVETREITEGVSLVLINWDDGHQPERLTSELVSALRYANGPWVVIAAHVPIAIGKRGGLPEPGQGSFRLRQTVLDAIEDAGVPVHVFLSGHHHSLQLLIGDGGFDPALHLIAGSGARWRRIEDRHPRRRFGANRLGFVRLDLYGEGDASRLVASLYRTATIPLMARGAPELVARHSIDRSGHVSDELDSAR